METALVTTTGNGLTIDEMARVAAAMAGSGYFQDAADVSKAMVKVLAGQEMGLGPFSSMTGIHIIKGKPVLGANLIATLIKNDPRYDYQIAELDNDGCVIDFYERGALVGNSSFNKADKTAAQLTQNNWTKYPRNMYFARAISNGARWYAPGIFGGAVVYTADELGADNDEDGYIIEVEPVPDAPDPEPTTDTNADSTPGQSTGQNGDIRGDSAPDKVAAREEQRPKAPVNGKDDWHKKAIRARKLNTFASAASFYLDEYDNEHHVTGGLEKLDVTEDNYDPNGNAGYLEQLIARKEADSG